MAEFFVLIAVICVIAYQMYRALKVYRLDINEDIKLERNLGTPTEISLEEVTAFVRETLDKESDVPLDQQFLQWLEDKDKPDLTKTSSEYVNVDNGECIGYECSCSPQREDCCKSIDNKRCVLRININKLCGIEEYVKNPELVTEDEADLLAKALTAYEKLKETK